VTSATVCGGAAVVAARCAGRCAWRCAMV
jgi:hypothetical protein